MTQTHIFAWGALVALCVAGVVASLYLFYSMSGVSADVSREFENEVHKWYKIRAPTRGTPSAVRAPWIVCAIAVVVVGCSLLLTVLLIYSVAVAVVAAVLDLGSTGLESALLTVCSWPAV